MVKPTHLNLFEDLGFAIIISKSKSDLGLVYITNQLIDALGFQKWFQVAVWDECFRLPGLTMSWGGQIMYVGILAASIIM